MVEDIEKDKLTLSKLAHLVDYRVELFRIIIPSFGKYDEGSGMPASKIEDFIEEVYEGIRTEWGAEAAASGKEKPVLDSPTEDVIKAALDATESATKTEFSQPQAMAVVMELLGNLRVLELDKSLSMSRRDELSEYRNILESMDDLEEHLRSSFSQINQELIPIESINPKVEKEMDKFLSSRKRGSPSKISSAYKLQISGGEESLGKYNSYENYNNYKMKNRKYENEEEYGGTEEEKEKYIEVEGRGMPISISNPSVEMPMSNYGNLQPSPSSFLQLERTTQFVCNPELRESPVAISSGLMSTRERVSTRNNKLEALIRKTKKTLAEVNVSPYRIVDLHTPPSHSRHSRGSSDSKVLQLQPHILGAGELGEEGEEGKASSELGEDNIDNIDMKDFKDNLKRERRELESIEHHNIDESNLNRTYETPSIQLHTEEHLGKKGAHGREDMYEKLKVEILKEIEENEIGKIRTASKRSPISYLEEEGGERRKIGFLSAEAKLRLKDAKAMIASSREKFKNRTERDTEDLNIVLNKLTASHRTSPKSRTKLAYGLGDRRTPQLITSIHNPRPDALITGATERVNISNSSFLLAPQPLRFAADDAHIHTHTHTHIKLQDSPEIDHLGGDIMLSQVDSLQGGENTYDNPMFHTFHRYGGQGKDKYVEKKVTKWKFEAKLDQLILESREKAKLLEDFNDILNLK